MEKSMLSKDEMRKVFLSCDMLNKDGLYADDVDISELGAAVEKEVALKYARAERAKCIEFVESLNPEVARALTDKRGGM
jgi:hypothetical protein